jgi:signal-transduction protein with cAMP-binding, CBS, and nucleotidyltransferase domain
MGLLESILSEPVSDLDLRPVVRARRGMTVREAVQRMRQASLGFVVLLDEEERPLHMFTERKLIKLCLASGNHLNDTIDSHYHKPADRVKQTQPIGDLLDMMQKGGIRFVCVVDDDGRIVGVTGQKGVMEYLADHFPRLVKVQRMDAKLSMSQREGA